MLCVLTRIASSRRFWWVQWTYHYCVEDGKDFPQLSKFPSWPGVKIYAQWLELPISRTKFSGPKNVRAIEVRLYFKITIFILSIGTPLLLTILVLKLEKVSFTHCWCVKNTAIWMANDVDPDHTHQSAAFDLGLNSELKTVVPSAQSDQSLRWSHVPSTAIGLSIGG